MFAPIRRTLSVSFASLCAVASLSPAFAGSRVSASDDGFAAVFTDWVAVVADGQDASACALEVESSGVGQITGVLSSIGILLVTTPSADGRGLLAVPCIEAIELDTLFGGSGIAGATN
jgi:hypothetical protein